MDAKEIGLESAAEFEASLSDDDQVGGDLPDPSASGTLRIADSKAPPDSDDDRPPATATPSRSGQSSSKRLPADLELYERWVGRQFSHFRLMRVLGAGAMGVVFQAEDVHLHRICALKVLRKQMKGGVASKQVERFLLEARAAAAIDHPSIASVYAINQHNGWWFIAQEFLEGGSLHDLVQATGALTSDRALLMLLDASRGLEAAHEAGVIHRDIKPSNLMLNRRGRCKLVDFGLVKLDSTDNPFQSDDKIVVGTPLYVAPEIVRKLGASLRSDVYSLGATTYALVTGRPPYTAKSVEEILRMHVEAPVPVLRDLLPNAPAFLDALIRRSMAKDPADRPTIEQFAAMLQREISTEGSSQLSGSGFHTSAGGSSSVGVEGADASSIGAMVRSRFRRSPLLLGGVLVVGAAATTTALLLPGAFTTNAPTAVTEASRPSTVTNTIGMTLVQLPPGEFTMGSPVDESGRNSDERQLVVTLTSGVAMSATEVTQAQWAQVMGEDYAPPEGVHPNDMSGLRFLGDALPAYASWHEAAEFCRRLSEMEGVLYRLPTEAEWEYACRAGSSTAFGLGDALTITQANFDAQDSPGRPLPVASYMPNEWGLYDMHGNVMEWCADWAGEYPVGAATDPSGPASGEARSLRGGAWDTTARVARSANRWSMPPVVRTDTIGFRVVMEADTPAPTGVASFLIERPATARAASAAPSARAPSVAVDPALPAYAPEQPLSQRIRSAGSDTMDELMLLWEERFREWHPAVRIRHEGRGSGTATPALLEGISHFGPMSRRVEATERSAFLAEFGYEPTQLIVAYDALAVIVHPDNPIAERGLTLAELDAVYSETRDRGWPAHVDSWGDLDVEGELEEAGITLFGRNAASGTHGVFQDEALSGGAFKRSVRSLVGSAAVVSAVSTDPTAIGYTGIGYVTDGVRTVPLARDSIDQASVPTPDASYDGRYPLARPLFLTINLAPGANPTDRQREFLRFVFSREGQSLAAAAGFFPVNATHAQRELARARLDQTLE